MEEKKKGEKGRGEMHRQNITIDEFHFRQYLDRFFSYKAEVCSSTQPFRGMECLSFTGLSCTAESRS